MSKFLALTLVLPLVSVWRVLGALQCPEETANIGSNYVLVHVSPSDSGHLLMTASEEEARNTAVCHAICISYIFEDQGSPNGSNATNGTAHPDANDGSASGGFIIFEVCVILYTFSLSLLLVWVCHRVSSSSTAISSNRSDHRHGYI